MKIPAIKGVIRRRILLNYRVDPEAVTRILPPNFNPKLVNGELTSREARRIEFLR